MFARIKFTLIFLLLTFFQFSFAETHTNKCVQIYYDKVSAAQLKYYAGRAYASMLQNLIGHFPSLQVYIIPIESYEAGQLNRCDASFYIGSYYDNKIPSSFLHDLVNTQKNVVWLGYNVWQLPAEVLKNLWGVSYAGKGSLDWQNRDADNNPGFYRFYDYKGEEFEKIVKGSPSPQDFDTNYDITLLQFIEPDAEKNVIAWARHSTQQNQVTPYILRNNNHWYIADNPFSYLGTDDRYLIFCDLLFDILNEKPVYSGKKPALVRFEDVNVGSTTPAQIKSMSDMFYKLKTPFVIALIPEFADPLMVIVKDPDKKSQTILDSADFLAALEYAKQKGATIIEHGVSHQYDEHRNPFNAVTASDFEFWDKVNEKPIPEDSVSYFLNRLDQGVTILDKAGMRPVAWETPHYLASPLDYVILSQVFTWNVGRMGYWPVKITQAKTLPPSLAFDQIGSKGNAERMQYFTDLVVRYPKNMLPIGQFFPYEIYGDAYGQRIIPENIGDIQSKLSEQVLQTKTIDDMIKTIKRNRVLRDVWASFFMHGFLTNIPARGGIGRYQGDTSELQRLITETVAAGYEFIDLQTWIKQNTKPKAPPAIEIDPPSYD